MDRKIDQEIKSLVKMGIPDNLAYLIACNKFGRKEEVETIIEDIKEEQKEIQTEIENFIEMSKNISLPVLYDKPTNKNEV